MKIEKKTLLVDIDKRKHTTSNYTFVNGKYQGKYDAKTLVDYSNFGRDIGLCNCMNSRNSDSFSDKTIITIDYFL